MSTSSLDWLPDRHLGVAATLSHADELIGQVSDVLFAYQTQPGGVFGLCEVPAGSVSRTVVQNIAPIPRKLPLLVADALVALRAALEHVLFAEVEFIDGTPLDEKAARLVEMPALGAHEQFEAWLKKRARNGPSSLYSGSELVRRIERLQPYHRIGAPEEHPLARLVLHTNHAKHRTPAITAVRLAAMYDDEDPPRSIRDVNRQPEAPLRLGDVISETPIGARVPVTMFPTVGLNRPDTERWPILMQELDEISHWVRTQAVPRLVTGAEPPQPALPARYAIAVGQHDERSAILAGSSDTAAGRHKTRLSAAVVRADIVELISRADEGPSEEQVIGWLAHLTDEEVLERMSRLKPTWNYDPLIVRRTINALEGLRDEVANFSRRENIVVE